MALWLVMCFSATAGTLQSLGLRLRAKGASPRGPRAHEELAEPRRGWGGGPSVPWPDTRGGIGGGLSTQWGSSTAASSMTRCQEDCPP